MPHLTSEPDRKLFLLLLITVEVNIERLKRNNLKKFRSNKGHLIDRVQVHDPSNQDMHSPIVKCLIYYKAYHFSIKDLKNHLKESPINLLVAENDLKALKRLCQYKWHQTRRHETNSQMTAIQSFPLRNKKLPSTSRTVP